MLYATQTPLAVREEQCKRIVAKHGESMLPIVLEAVGKYSKVSFTALPANATVADLAAAVRELGDVSQRNACALQIAGCTPASTTTIGDLHAAYKGEDGFLYVSYTGEKAMGCMFPFPMNQGSDTIILLSGATTI